MKQIILLGLCSLLSLTALAQSEICDDGIDNDNDGFIDCYDPDCSNFSKCDGTFLGNDALCQAKPIQFPKFTMKVDFKSPDGTTNNLSRMAIGDLDRDGVPEIITMNRYTKELFVLDGRNGSIKNSISTSFEPQWEIAIANLDNDNCAEIFTFGTESGGTYLYAYDCTLSTQLWKTQIPGDPINFGLADFNGDGKVELYAKDEIYDAKTGIRLVKSSNWNINGGPVAVDIQGNSDLELIIGCAIYSVNLGPGTPDGGSLTLVKDVSTYKRKNEFNATSVADYNQDGFLDVIASGALIDAGGNRVTTVFFWDVKNNVVKTYSDPQPSISSDYEYGWKNGTGRVNIADLDGDGKLNASFVSGRYLYALDENFGLYWKTFVNEETSGYTGCTLFDFNGDGASEVVYRDERNLYIINGTTGTLYPGSTIPCISRTNREYPIVADVDADGSTEICVPCISDDNMTIGSDFSSSDSYLKVPSQIRVYKSASEPWVPARRLWNQHGYFNVNVNDDLTIPIRQQSQLTIFSVASCTPGPNRPLNTFLNQSPYLDSKGCPTYASPDLAHVANSLVVTPPTCPDANFTVTFKITNLGDVQLDGTVPVTFYNGDPTKAGAVKLNTVQVSLSSFKPKAIFSITNATVNGPGSSFTLYIVLNDNGTTVPTPISLPNSNFVECDYGNNIIQSPITPKPVALTAIKVADNLKCVGSTTPDNGAARAYVLNGAVQNTADYNFYWFKGAAVTGTPAYVGASYTGLAAGLYTVYAIHKTASCSSDTVNVTVGQINRSVNVSVSLISGVIDCKVPNGQLKAVVNNGNEPASNFTFRWYEGNDIFTAPQVGVSDLATDLKALTYTVDVKDNSSGCETIESITVPNNTVVPVVTASKVDILCSNASSGSASANVGGSTTGYTFEWSKGTTAKPSPGDFTGSTYSSLAAGKYTVIARQVSSNCASAPVTVTITQTTAPVVTASVTALQTSCDPTKPNGAVVASGSGGSGNFSFEWFKGQNTAAANKIASVNTASGLNVGIYTAKITDITTGCSATKEATVTLSIGPTPVISAVPVNQTQCVPYNGNITATVSAGLPSDYTFYWYKGNTVKASTDFPDTDNILDNIPAGIYTVKAIHKTNFCQAAPKTFTVLDQSPTISIQLNSSITVYPTDCNSADGVMSVSVSAPGNTLGFKAEWFLGKSPYAAPAIKTDNGVTSSTASGLKSGVYSVIATDINSGCLSSKAFDLPFVSSPTLSLISKTDILKCVPDNDGQVTVKLNLPPVGGFTESDYDLFTYQGTNDPGATGTSVVPIIAGVAGQANYTTAATLTADSYTIVAVSKKAGQFNGCRSVPLSVDIDKNTTDPVITSSSISANTNCAGVTGTGQITASANVSSTFDWFNGSSVKAVPDLSNSATYSNLVSDFYTVRATDNATGCFAVATFSVPDNPMTVSIAANGLTVQDLMTCNISNGTAINNGSASIASISPGALSDYTFSWSTTTGSLPGTTSSISNLSAGKYFARALNTASNCFTTLEFAIEDKTINSASVELNSFSQPERCIAPKSGSLTVTNTPSYSYEWFAGTSPSGPVVHTTNDFQGITVPSGQKSTTYTIKAIGPNNCWAVDSYTLPLVVNEVFITASSSSPLTYCSSNNGVVFGTVINDNSLDYSYFWSNGTTVKATPDHTGKQVQNLGAGSYTIIAVDLLDNFCVSQPKTVVLEDKRVAPPVAAAQSSPLTNCDPAKLNGVATADVNGDVLRYVFDWYAGATATGTSFFSGPVANSLKDGIYTVVATDRITGCSGTTQVTVSKNLTVVANPQITILSQVTSCLDPNGSLSAAVNGETKDYIFDWYVGSTIKSTADYHGEVINDLDVGMYTVTATSRLTGCISAPDTDELFKQQIYPEFDLKVISASCQKNNGSATLLLLNSIDVETIEWDYNGSKVYGPTLANALSGTYDVKITTQLGCSTGRSVSIQTDIRPFNGVSRNGDSRNDIFYIDCIENFPSNNVKVFNRAGTLVYEGNNYDNTSTFFDGKSNRGISPMGVNLPDGTYYYIIDKGDGSKPKAGYLELVN